MTGENEQERESAGELMPPHEPAPESDSDSGDSDTPDSGDVTRRSRRFRAWGAANQAQESGPSFWHRTSERIKRLFARPKRDAEVELEHAAEIETDLAEDQFAVEQGAVHAGDEAADTWTAGDAVDVAAAPAEDELSIPVIPAPEEVEASALDIEVPVAPADGPRESLKFLWAPDDEPRDEAQVADAAAAEPEEGERFDKVVQAPARRISFFKRLFARKAAAEEVPDTDEHDVSAAEPEAEVAHAPGDVQDPEPDYAPADAGLADAALDEALPAEEAVVDAVDGVPEDEGPDADAFAVDAVPEPPRKPGFFARLFGRKAAPVAPEFVETEVGFEDAGPEDGVDAAGQLDAVDQGFAAARDEFAPPEHAGQSFGTVEDALPLDGPTLEPMPAVTESSFAPPPVEAAPPAAASAGGDEHQFFGGNTFDFDTPKPDDRATKEVTPVPDDRKTAELPPEVLAHADEEDRDTDEFEMVTLQEPAVSPLEGKTAEVPKVSLFKKLFSRTKEVTQVEPAVAPPPSANPTFLVQKFRTFYNEVVVYRNQKTDLTAGFATAIVTSYDADLSPEQAAQSLAQRLQQMLELQLAESSWMGGEIQELYPDAQYAMACLADEMLTNLEWPGQAAWGKHRLELTVFKTAASDLEVFKRIDRLLKNGPQTTGTRDLARVYLLVVASGFKGKYRPFDLPRALAEYRRRLYEFVYGGDALMLYADDRRIFPEAVSVTVAGRGVKRFSLAQQWAAILVLLLVGYTVISHLAWKKVSADLKDIAARVEQARNPVPLDTPNSSGGR